MIFQFLKHLTSFYEIVLTHVKHSDLVYDSLSNGKFNQVVLVLLTPPYCCHDFNNHWLVETIKRLIQTIGSVELRVVLTCCRKLVVSIKIPFSRGENIEYA